MVVHEYHGRDHRPSNDYARLYRWLGLGSQGGFVIRWDRVLVYDLLLFQAPRDQT